MLCYDCFNEYDADYGLCPYCGAEINDGPLEPIHLIPGTLLNGRYLIGHAIGSGGFGIIYKAWDTKLETIIAVKEFFYPVLMTRAQGESEVIVTKKSVQEFEYRKDRFLAEARIMAKFGDHRNIPNVFEFFEENGTAYIVMELLSGIGLNTFLSRGEGKTDIDYALHVANEIGKALCSMHDKGIIHRDVAPDNVFICDDKEQKIKLLDLGAAKLSSDDDTVIDIILKPGYSPIEQYDSTGTVGVWSDVYALGATLYVMLTGVKPDEATNRRIDDKLVQPKDIDASISENLSNAIMKAMALDRHMRFGTVREFLKAINGNRKVIPLAKEKKRRKHFQIIGIALAVIALVVGGIVVGGRYREMEVDAYLEKANISVWYEADANSNEEEAMKQIVNDFCGKYVDVTIDLVRYSSDEYKKALEIAAENNNLPNLFESTNASDNVMAHTISVDEVLESEQALACYFLSEYYSDCYSNHNKIPLGFEMPVAIVITGGSASVSYSDTTFSSLADFSNGKIAFDSNVKDFISKSFNTSDYSEKQFGTVCSVLITSTMNMKSYEEKLMSNEWHYAYCDNSTGRFIYEWSLGKGTNAQNLASNRLLSWMLGNSYQSNLMVNWAQNGEIPLSKRCFDEYSSMTNSYDGLKSIITKITFVK